MNKKLIEEIKRACTQGKLYDFISNESFRLDKSDLVSVIGEALWITSKTMNEFDYIRFQNEIAKSIEENCSDDDD